MHHVHSLDVRGDGAGEPRPDKLIVEPGADVGEAVTLLRLTEHHPFGGTLVLKHLGPLINGGRRHKRPATVGAAHVEAAFPISGHECHLNIAGDELKPLALRPKRHAMVKLVAVEPVPLSDRQIRECRICAGQFDALIRFIELYMKNLVRAFTASDERLAVFQVVAPFDESEVTLASLCIPSAENLSRGFRDAPGGVGVFQSPGLVGLVCLFGAGDAEE